MGERHTQNILVAGVAALIPLLAGCGGSDRPQEVLPSGAITSPPPSSPSPQTTQTTASPSTGSPLGTQQQNTDPMGTATVTVFGFKQPAARGDYEMYGQPGLTLAAVDARVCVTETTGAPITVSRGPWRLVYADFTQQEALSSSGSSLYPRPEYPLEDQVVETGRCVRGMIPFEVTSKSRPTTVEYDPGNGDALRWAVPNT